MSLFMFSLTNLEAKAEEQLAEVEGKKTSKSTWCRVKNMLGARRDSIKKRPSRKSLDSDLSKQVVKQEQEQEQWKEQEQWQEQEQERPFPGNGARPLQVSEIHLDVDGQLRAGLQGWGRQLGLRSLAQGKNYGKGRVQKKKI